MYECLIIPKLLATPYTKVDYQDAGLSSPQLGDESEYTFAELSNTENYKEWAIEMVFALKNL